MKVQGAPQWHNNCLLDFFEIRYHFTYQKVPETVSTWPNVSPNLVKLGAILALTWHQLGLTWASVGQLGPTWANLGQLGANLGPTWGNLGLTWGHLGANLGPTRSQLGANSGPTCANLGPPCGQLRANLGKRPTWERAKKQMKTTVRIHNNHYLHAYFITDL